MQHGIDHKIIMIQEASMLHVLSTLRECWASFEVFSVFKVRMRPYGGPIFLMDWITID